MFTKLPNYKSSGLPPLTSSMNSSGVSQVPTKLTPPCAYTRIPRNRAAARNSNDARIPGHQNCRIARNASEADIKKPQIVDEFGHVRRPPLE
jgi:hypothetical protein